MQRIMQNNAAVFRTGETLKEGVKLIDEVFQDSLDLKTVDRSLVWYVNTTTRSTPIPHFSYSQHTQEHRLGGGVGVAESAVTGCANHAQR